MQPGTASQISQVEYREGTLFRLSGVINDTFDASHIDVRQGVAVFDFDGVTGITSFGARKWMEALALLNADYYCFVRCHAPVIWQFNTIVGFGRSGELVSLYAPYVCGRCDRELEQFIDLRRDYHILESLGVPELLCPSCGTPAHLDDLPEVYFECVRAAACPRPPAAANAIIDNRASREQTVACSVRKVISDSVTAIWVAGNLDKAAYSAHLADGLEGHVVVVLAELEAITPEGAEGLSDLIRVAPSTCYLARVPLELAAPVRDMLARTAGSARVVSLEAGFTCPSCQRRLDLELVESDLLSLEGDDRATVCPRCADPLIPAFTQEEARIAGELPMSRPPEQVAFYVRNSRSFPSGKGSGPESGRELFPSKYRVMKLLGEGGMGQVFLARQLGPEAFERLVVLKRIRRDYLESPEAIRVFVQEARLAARLIHPNIVQVYELARFEGEYFMAMEYVNGIDLANALSFSRRIGLTWPIGICCRIMSDLCCALDAAHGHKDSNSNPQPIIHRDVSPGNVLISVEGEVKLADFGVATALDSSLRTPPGVIKGKVAYSAPEQFSDRRIPVDTKVDIYAAGVVLYECITQRRYPISGGSPARRRTLPLSIRGDVPADLEHAYQKAVARDPAARWSSVRELQLAVEAVLQSGRYTSRDALAIFIRALINARESPSVGEYDEGPSSYSDDDGEGELGGSEA